MTVDQLRDRDHLARRRAGVRAASDVVGATVARHRSFAVFAASTLLIAVAAAMHNGYLFTTPLHEASDEALNGLLITRADHGHQLVGNYSRVGFDHPGPALLYMLAASQGLFFSWLHVVPAPYNAQLLGASVFGAAVLALAVLTLLRATLSPAVAAAALGVFAVFALRLSMVGDQVWFPYLYMAPFLLLVVSGSCLAFGRTGELPTFVLALGLLVHGHVSFIGIGGVTALFVLSGWLITHRGARREELAGHRRALALGGALVALFALPMVLEVVLHFPGPWPQYVHYLSAGAHGGGGSFNFLGWYFTEPGVPAPLLAGAALTASALWATGRRRERERLFGPVYAMVAVQTLLFVAYVESSVDLYDPVNHYIGFFYLTVPVVLIATALAHAIVRVSSVATVQRLTARPAVGRGLAVAAGIVLVAAAASTSQPPDKFLHGFDYSQLVRRLAAEPARDGRVMAIGFDPDLWPQAAGVAIAADRAGVPWCVSGTDPHAQVLFTIDFICAGRAVRWRVTLVAPSHVVPGSTPIYVGPMFAVVAG